MMTMNDHAVHPRAEGNVGMVPRAVTVWRMHGVEFSCSITLDTG